MSAIRRKRAIEGGRGNGRVCWWLCGKMCEGVFVCVCACECGCWIEQEKNKLQAELIIMKCKE